MFVNGWQLLFFVNGRQPQLFVKLKTSSVSLASPSLTWAWHSSAPACLFYLVCDFFHQFDQHPQMLRKNTFFAPNWISFFIGIFVFRWKKFHVHCGTSCKIRTPTDKNCGNESKIRLTHKICRFTPIFLPSKLLT